MVTCRVYAEFTLAATFPHSRLLVCDFGFLTSDFQSPPAPALSTLNCELSTCSLTLLECVAVIESLAKIAPTSHAESIMYKIGRLYPLCNQYLQKGGGTPLVAIGGKLGERSGPPRQASARPGRWTFVRAGQELALAKWGNFTRARHVDSFRIALLEVTHVL